LSIRLVAFLSLSFVAFLCADQTLLRRPETTHEQRDRLLIIDTHIDLPYRLQEKMEDVSRRTSGGAFDYPRALEGGLGVAFMSIYVPSSYGPRAARDVAQRMIRTVERIASSSSGKFGMAYSVADVRSQAREGVIMFALGLENGSPIGSSLRELRYLHYRGIRYMTLTHAKGNRICDSASDPDRKWNGLSPFGKRVVEEMNRLGMMIDVSHISDSAFFQVLRLTKAPVIASHSSCRYFTPGWERNMSDEMIFALAKNGGVIQINFGSAFLRADIPKRSEEMRSARPTRERRSSGQADVGDVVAHIDHVVQLVGVDYVGIGSDFDGVGGALPVGLQDVSSYPNLVAKLRERGYTEEDIRKICGENLLRVWSQVEQTATGLASKPVVLQ
jgi:membrane dipeptidase